MENKTILNIILISLLVLYISGFIFIMVAYVAPAVRNRRKKGNQLSVNGEQPSEIQAPASCGINSSQTDFYKKSVEHAEKVLFGKAFDPQCGEANHYANKLIDTIGKLNNETKQSVIIAIKHFSIESAKARANEQLFRTMSQQEGVPLWFIILREAMKEAVPEFMQTSNNQMPAPNNIVPLYQKTG